jgi:hypothetical protein
MLSPLLSKPVDIGRHPFLARSRAGSRDLNRL